MVIWEIITNYLVPLECRDALRQCRGADLLFKSYARAGIFRSHSIEEVEWTAKGGRWAGHGCARCWPSWASAATNPWIRIASSGPSSTMMSALFLTGSAPVSGLPMFSPHPSSPSINLTYASSLLLSSSSFVCPEKRVFISLPCFFWQFTVVFDRIFGVRSRFN